VEAQGLPDLSARRSRMLGDRSRRGAALSTASTVVVLAALVTDTPTAQFISSSEIPGSVMVAQFPSAGEHYGLLFAKGNPLVTCVNKALATLKSNGTLAQLTTKYLKLYTSVPTIKP